jgi:regulator of replication initiation timing
MENSLNQLLDLAVELQRNIPKLRASMEGLIGENHHLQKQLETAMVDKKKYLDHIKELMFDKKKDFDLIKELMFNGM